MLQASDLTWQHFATQSAERQDNIPIDAPDFIPAGPHAPLGDWDLSELFHSTFDPRALASMGSLVANPFADTSDIDNQGSSPHNSVYHQQQSEMAAQHQQQQQYSTNHRLEYSNEPSYDLYSPAPSTFASQYRAESSGPSSHQPSPALTASHISTPQDMYFTNAHGYPTTSASNFELINALSSLTTVPEDCSISPGPNGMLQRSSSAASPYAIQTSNMGTISPTAVNKVSESFAPEPSFAELMMDNPSPSSSYVEDASGSPLRFSQNPRPQYPLYMPTDPSSSSATSRPTNSVDVLRRSNPHVFKSEVHHHQHNTFDGHIQYSSQIDGPSRVSIPSSARLDDEPGSLSLGYGGSSVANDVVTSIRPYLDHFIASPNRLAAGERTLIVMSSKVAQKSYGTEKRFLCPPPTAIMIGNSWWSESTRDSKAESPRITISISGEPTPPEGVVDWTTPTGKPLDISEGISNDVSYIGRCVGKQLYISDVDERKKKVEALIKVVAPGANSEEKVIGTFLSRPIKVISKPSKKRQSAKNLELCINHGSTVSLFHRLRSQTVSTKYLCVSGSGASFKGSDGAPLPGLDPRQRSNVPSFVARTASWDMFIMYVVDVTKPTTGPDAQSPPTPPQSDYPTPPPNAIPCSTNGSQIPIYYNQTVVLQCLTSGVVSPVLIIRKVDHATTVVGGGLQDGAKGVPDHYCVNGEVCGDPVSQLHKIALEVYEADKGIPEGASDPGSSGSFLSCMGEKVNTHRPGESRQWNGFFSGHHHMQTGSSSPSLPGSPVSITPPEYGMPHLSSGSNSPTSPTFGSDYTDIKTGSIRRKRNSLNNGGVVKSSRESSTSSQSKTRRRVNSAGSSGSNGRGAASAGGEHSTASGALWSIDIGETAVWTVVGTDQIRYNFYVPPILFDNPPSLLKPVTPFPGVVKYLPPDRAAEAPKAHHTSRTMTASNPIAAKLLTVYGENFNKSDPIHVFFGSEPSPYVEVRCTEVLACLPPENSNGNSNSHSHSKRPIVLVRNDGVVFPTGVYYP